MTDAETNISPLSLRELPHASVINRRAIRRLGALPVSVDLNFRVVPDIEHSTVSLIVTCSYSAVMSYIKTRLMACPILATFEVENLKEHVDVTGEEAIVGSRLMMMMLNVVVGALRGIIAVRTAGTPLARHPLPLVDMAVLMRKLNYGRASQSNIFQV